MIIKELKGYPENNLKCCECEDTALIRIATKSREMCLCDKHARTLKAKLFYLYGGGKNETK